MNTLPVIIPYFKDPIALEKNKEVLKSLINIKVDLFVRDNSIDNILYTKAVNEGLRKYCYSKEYKYVMILNQDAYLSTDAVDQMILIMENNPKCGICTPISIDDNNLVNWCGGLDVFPVGRHLSIPLNEIVLESLETYWSNGACMLMRTEMVREIGLLDENMLFIFSDSDYSFTAVSRGWKNLVATKAFVKHSPSGSASVQNNWLTEIKLKDQLYFAEKWLNGSLFKKISYEGQKLSDMTIKDHIRKIKNSISLIQSI